MLIKWHKSPVAYRQKGGQRGLAVPGTWQVGKGDDQSFWGPSRPSTTVWDLSPLETFTYIRTHWLPISQQRNAHTDHVTSWWVLKEYLVKLNFFCQWPSFPSIPMIPQEKKGVALYSTYPIYQLIDSVSIQRLIFQCPLPPNLVNTDVVIILGIMTS